MSRSSDTRSLTHPQSRKFSQERRMGTSRLLRVCLPPVLFVEEQIKWILHKKNFNWSRLCEVLLTLSFSFSIVLSFETRKLFTSRELESTTELVDTHAFKGAFVWDHWIRNKNNWNNASKRLFRSYSYSGIPGFPFRLFCSWEQNSRNIFRNIFLFQNIPNERALNNLNVKAEFIESLVWKYYRKNLRFLIYSLVNFIVLYLNWFT